MTQPNRADGPRNLQRYFDLYDLAPVGYCTISEKGIILESNLTLANLLGVSWNELARQPFTHFILKEDQDICYLHSKQLLENKESQTYEPRMLKKDGVMFWVSVKASSAASNSDTVCRLVIIDITARKQSEAEQEKLQARLTQAQKMESIGRLAGCVAHDFNNMLSVILGYTEIALKKLQPDRPDPGQSLHQCQGFHHRCRRAEYRDWKCEFRR